MLMRKLLLLAASLGMYQAASAQVFTENFDAGVPGQFTQNYLQGTIDWNDGTGANMGGVTIPFAGTNSAILYEGANSGNQTSLTSPTIDLSAGGYSLEFQHVQRVWAGDQNTLLVELSTDAGATWNTVVDLQGNVANWTLQSFNLDNVATLTATCQIRFTGTIGYGYGLGLDDISVFTPPAVDIEFLGITMPGQNQVQCGMNTLQTVSVSFDNLGIGAADTVFLNYQLNQGSTVTDTIIGPFQGGSGPFTHTINNTFNFSTTGTYTIDAWTASTGDVDPTNDSTSTSGSYVNFATTLEDTLLCNATTLNSPINYSVFSQWLSRDDMFTPIYSGMSPAIQFDRDSMVIAYPADSVFGVDSLANTGMAIDHNSWTGDDRGGIAITPSFLFINGDNDMVRLDANTLAYSATLPRRDGIFSDLRDGSLYTLWDTTSGGSLPTGTSLNSFTVNSLRVMDTDLNLTDTVLLSTSFLMGGTSSNDEQAGIYAGENYVIVYTGTQGENWYMIDLPSGQVTFLNNFDFEDKRPNENWSHWGYSEYLNGEYFVTYRQNGSENIVRMNVQTEQVDTIRTFTALGDMASITYSPWHSRLYFHYENTHQFGGGAESGGYIDGYSEQKDLRYIGACGKPIDVTVSQTVADIQDDTTICDNENLVLRVGDFDGFINILWSDGSFDSTLTVSSAGMYSVTVTDTFNCVKTDSTNLSLTPAPQVDLGPDRAVCEGDILILDAGTGRDGYVWGNNSTDQTQVVVTTGTYGVTIQEGSCFDSDEVDVTVNPLPVVNIGSDTTVSPGAVLTFDAGAGFSAYNWSTTDTTATATLTAGADMYVSVEVTDANGCTASDELLVSVLLSNGDLDQLVEAIQVYPNPANEQTNVAITLTEDAEGLINLTDLSGKVVYTQTQTWNAGKQVVNIPLSEISSGVYFLSITIDNESAGSLKLIKH